MLKLENIKKDYIIDKTTITHALQGISLDFNNTGLVAILGPSGCGKTTLLNIISGLDKYTEGDLIIDDVSTKNYTSKDWDDYRNKKVGMIFQSYNLIPHLTILENTALPLTLAGVSQKEKKEKANFALNTVGLEEQKNKKPNQLSGGQQQRVAIARAIINDPSIILADEPTGALDSVTSEQVLQILLQLSKKKLIIMVTHNQELAKKYASRIITMRDGLILSDEPNYNQISIEESNLSIEFNKIEELGEKVENLNADKETLDIDLSTKSNENKKNKMKQRKSKMSFWTAFMISFKNLLVKKGRTILTAVASSFGIIGIGLVLAVSNGFSSYVKRNEEESLSQFPVTIESVTYKTEDFSSSTNNLTQYPDSNTITVYNPSNYIYHYNTITTDYYENFLKNMDPSLYNSIQVSYDVSANIITKNGEDSYKKITTTSTSGINKLLGNGSNWTELPGNKDFILSQYDYYSVDGKDFPSEDDPQSLVIVMDSYNRITSSTLSSLGFDVNTYKDGYTFEFSELKYKVYRQFTNDEFYHLSNDESKTNNNIAGITLREGKSYTDIVKAIIPLTNSDGEVTEEAKEEAFKSILSCFIDMDQFLNEDGSYNEDKLKSKMATLLPKIMLTPEYLAFKAAQTDDAKEELWQPLLQKVVTILSEDQDLGISSKTSLPSYVSPSGDELKNIYNYGKYNATKDDTLIPDGTERDIKIVGVLRPKKGTIINLLGSGVYYTKALTQRTLKWAQGEIADANNDYFMLNLANISYSDYKNLNIDFSNLDTSSLSNNNDLYNLVEKLPSYYDIFSANSTLTSSSYSTRREQIGTDTGIGSISIYPKDFNAKDKVLQYLDSYNTGKTDSDQIIYTDAAGTVLTAVSTMVNVISTVLIIFASISLVVSSVMIGIIIYVSVIERTKEIGTLRSIGARKIDVSNLFVMESVTIGFLAGLIGIILTYLISVPINIVVNNIYSTYSIGSIAFLNPWHALILVLLSTLLTFIAGAIPSGIAGRKDPVKCLRTNE